MLLALSYPLFYTFICHILIALVVLTKLSIKETAVSLFINGMYVYTYIMRIPTHYNTKLYNYTSWSGRRCPAFSSSQYLDHYGTYRVFYENIHIRTNFHEDQ